MTEKILDSTRTGMTRSSSHLIPSIYGNDLLELVMENGQILVREASSNKTQKTHSSNKEITIDHEDESVTKRAKLSTFSSLSHHFPTQRNSQFCSSHNINGQDSTENNNNSLKFCEEFANLRPKKVSRFKEPRMDSTHSTQDQRKGKVNFPNFSIPTMFQTTRNVSNSSIIESAKGPQSQVLKGFQKKPSLSANNSKPALAPLDEHSEAVVDYNSSLGIHKSHGNYYNQTLSMEELRAKGKVGINLCNEPLKLGASSSVCSLGASNDANSGLRINDYTDDSVYFNDNDEEIEDIVKETPAEEGSRVKRSRNPEIHNLSERKRRDKINKRMRALKELIPNCKKMDKASMLDYAIDYLQTLKLQLQIMSMRNGLCMPLPPMMLPSPTHHHMNNAIPHLPQLMGSSGGTGFPFTPPQFPPPILPLSHMFGFSNQVPLPHVPAFIPLMGNNSSTQPPLMPENPDSTSSDLHANAEISMKQAPNCNQVSLPHSTSYPLYFPTENEDRKGKVK